MNMNVSEHVENEQSSENKSKCQSCWFGREAAFRWRQRSWSETHLSWRWRTWPSFERWSVFLERRRSSSSLSCCPSPRRERSKGLRSGSWTPSHPALCVEGLNAKIAHYVLHVSFIKMTLLHYGTNVRPLYGVWLDKAEAQTLISAADIFFFGSHERSQTCFF